jgi:hypothetical protein
MKFKPDTLSGASPVTAGSQGDNRQKNPAWQQNRQYPPSLSPQLDGFDQKKHSA